MHRLVTTVWQAAVSRLLNVWTAECQANCLGIQNLIQNNLRIYKFENLRIPQMVFITLYYIQTTVYIICVYIYIMCVYICHKSVYYLYL